MKIFTASQLKEWDACTLPEEGISQIDLIERAATACYRWFTNNGLTRTHIRIFCGIGNNGADGLALARMLIEHSIITSVYIMEPGKEGSAAFRENLKRLKLVQAEVVYIKSELYFPILNPEDIIIDAIFGTGLNKPPVGVAAGLISYFNNSGARIVSIDIPSGLFADRSSKGSLAVFATQTLTFQTYKAAFLFSENDRNTGSVQVLDIGLSRKYENVTPAAYELVEKDMIRNVLLPRNKFSHKGTFGHAALLAGSYGMMGAAVLSARACNSSGVGKLTMHIPGCGYHIMQAMVPEGMCRVSGENNLISIEDLEPYQALGIGPGIGVNSETPGILENIFSHCKSGLVLDADALNCLAGDKKLLKSIPAGTVITPHPKEFERLFGKAENDFERLEAAVRRAVSLNIYIILKGHYTAVLTPAGKGYFNSTGNAGMAKAGMGDVLTGILTGLLAQKYPLPEAALLAVYLHGMAGDIAAEKFSQEAMQATDLINCLGEAWKILRSGMDGLK